MAGRGSTPEFVEALARGLDVRTGVTARTIRRAGTGFAVDCGAVPDTRTLRASAVVVATPAAKSARLLAEVAPRASADLAGIETASVAIVTLAYDGARLPPGSGLLVGAREALAVKGVTLTSQKWGLAGPGLLRASLGRAGDVAVLQRGDDQLLSLVRHELGVLLGVTDDPIDSLVTRWGGGLPQYGVGHSERVARIRAAVATVPGLAICGGSFDGVGIPACIASARAAVARLGE